MADATEATCVARSTPEKDLGPLECNGNNQQEFNENWQERVDFYDCGAVFEDGYNFPDDVSEVKHHIGHERRVCQLET